MRLLGNSAYRYDHLPGQDQIDCEARDNARQIRDEADYQDEPSLGYLSSPPGLLPIPLTSRNTSSN